jgi:hypothetical protein
VTAAAVLTAGGKECSARPILQTRVVSSDCEIVLLLAADFHSGFRGQLRGLLLFFWHHSTVPYRFLTAL